MYTISHIRTDKYVHLIIGALPVFLSIVFFFDLISIIGVVGMPGEFSGEFHLNTSRSLIAYLVFAGSCYVLKRSNWHIETVNDQLINELTKKNAVISQQAEHEVSRLNEDLQRHIDALTRRETLLKKSQQIAKIGSWEFDLTNNILAWSDQTYEIFGLDKSFDLTTPDLNQLLFGTAAPLIDESIRNLIKEKKSYDLTCQIRTPIGYNKWIRVNGFPVVADDRVVAASGIVHDITYYKEAEEYLRAGEARYRNLFEQASDAILVHDFEGKMLDVNQSMCNLFGYTKAELLMMPLKDLMDKDEIEQRPLKYEEVARGERVFTERVMIARDGRKIPIESNVRKLNESHAIAIVRDITARKQIEEEKEHTQYLLKERIKELTTLNRVSNILSQEEKDLDKILTSMVEALPPGWQFPAICSARIHLFDKTFQSVNYQESGIKISSPIGLHDQTIGHIEVNYVDDPVLGNEPFLKEELDLLNTISDMLKIFLEQQKEQEERNSSEANLVATINNTGIFIWSVDTFYRVLTFNEPFYQYMLGRYNVKLEVGKEVLDNMNPLDEEFKAKWNARYARALAGETFSMEETSGSFDFQFRLSPIKRQGEIIGISVFAEDVTQRNKRERELAEAVRKIGDLQLMALRSVMNPHFIFNALNSIQYFITKNDRINAISYLSTFAKLVRGILTSSVDKKIKLSTELELLRHYVSLEQLRFEDKFNFELEVDSELDTDTIEIPSLLIQPYVENAIIHGLYNKKEHGNLWIRVRDNGEAIVLEVEDDGVGRKEARKIRESGFPQHRSMGMYVTEERLQLINQSSDHVSVEFQDLYNDETATGTLVRIWISNES